jgi:phosphatidylserine/phosphatidylglycerophosphate/cardiolipin synthase-like enzyme
VETEAQGFSRSQLLAILDAGSQDDPASRDFSWVITGIASPSMPRRDTAVVYRSLVQQARREVIISTYAVYNGKELFAELRDKMAKDAALKVRLLCDVRRAIGDTSIDSEIAAKFKRDFLNKQWPGEPFPDIYYFPAALSTGRDKKAVLHAKCMIVDSRIAFVGSANLTTAAQEKNIEVGVLLEDTQQVESLRRYFIELIESGTLLNL